VQVDARLFGQTSHRGSSMLQSANQKRRVVAALAPALMLPTGIPFPSTATSLSSRPIHRLEPDGSFRILTRTFAIEPRSGA
jgi:hypothetical protein